MKCETKIVARYAETDQMGIIHHSVYPIWFEAARTEFIKLSGITYTQLEQQGVIYSRRGAGWYVSDNVDVAKNVFDELVHSKTVAYLNDMESLGLSKKDIINIIKEFRYE